MNAQQSEKTECARELQKQLLRYSVAASAVLAGAQTAKGEVIHTDLDPDATIKAGWHGGVGEPQAYAIDMNDDAALDFAMWFSSYLSSSSSSGQVYLQVRGLVPGNEVATSGLFPGWGSAIAFYEGSTVSANAGQWYGSRAIAWSFWTSSWSSQYGPFAAGTTDRYLGVRFQVGGQGEYYGWIQVQVPALGWSGYLAEATITGFAYESSGGAIQTPSAAVPDESSTIGLGLLALGAAGVMQYKARRARVET